MLSSLLGGEEVPLFEAIWELLANWGHDNRDAYEQDWLPEEQDSSTTKKGGSS